MFTFAMAHPIITLFIAWAITGSVVTILRGHPRAS